MLIILKNFSKIHRRILGKIKKIKIKEPFIFSSTFTGSLAFEELSEHGREKVSESGKKCSDQFSASSFSLCTWMAPLWGFIAWLFSLFLEILDPPFRKSYQCQLGRGSLTLLQCGSLASNENGRAVLCFLCSPDGFPW